MNRRIRKKRAPTIKADDIVRIQAILDNWHGKLTWAGLIDRVQLHLKRRYVRQTLSQHKEIALAFATRKRTLADGTRGRAGVTPELEAAFGKIEVLEASLARVTAERDRLLEKFVRWAYNASTKNITEDFLEQPMRPIDRRPSPLRRGRRGGLFKGRSRA